MPFCTQCGHNNPDGSRFCSQCGTRLESAGPAEASTGGAAGDNPSDSTATKPAAAAASALGDVASGK